MNKHTRSTFESKLLESNGFLIARIGSESHKRFAAMINKWDVGMYEQAVLTMLNEIQGEGITSQTQLGELVGIDPRNLVPVIDSLEQRKLVVRMPDKKDRRRSSIKLTTQGQSIASEIQQAGQVLEK